MPSSASVSLQKEILAMIDSALMDLERTIPGVSRSRKVRREARAAVAAALASLDRDFIEATGAATRKAMEEMVSSVPTSREPFPLATIVETATRRALRQGGSGEPRKKRRAGASKRATTPRPKR